MKKIILVSVLLFSFLNTQISYANESAQKLGVCMTDSLNGKERKNLAKWIFFGMSAHSSINKYINASQEDFDSTNKFVGELITRLLTVDCPVQAKKAIDDGGPAAFEFAFRIVGEVAMQEIMAEASVADSLGSFEKYIDQDKFDETFSD